MIDALKPYPAYKDSGVPWLGQVPEHWEVRRLKTAVDHINEQTSTKTDEDLYIALEHVESWTGRLLLPTAEAQFDSQVKRFRAGDVLFGKLRPYLAKVVRPKQGGVCVGEFFVFRARFVVAPHYLEVVLRSAPAIDFVNSSTYGAKMPRADWSFVGAMLLPLPPLPEQTAIVRFLEYMDRRIRRVIHARQRQIKLLEEYRQALIHQAVTGQIDVRTGKPYPAYKESGVPWLGQVPEHWEVRKLRALFNKAGSGTTPSGEEFYGGDIPWVITGDLNDSILSNTTRTVNARALENFSALRLYPKDSLIIAMYGATIGKTAILGTDACTNQACCVLAEPRTGVLVRYIHSAVISAKGYLVRQGYGGGQPNINSEIVHSLRIPVPPFEEQTAIVEYLDAQTTKIDTAIAAARREIELLREYRERLIADVVTGKVDVREVAARLPEELPEEENDGPEPSDEAETFASDGEDEEAIDFDEVAT
jgi:type I restriction enzyme S subunit